MKQEIKIFLLRAKKISNLWKMHNKSQGFMYLQTASILDGIPHHLYATTSETPKEGDWYIRTNPTTGKKELLLDKNDAHGMCDCRKIVATDDNLQLLQDSSKCVADLIIENKVFLPKISPEFQQTYVKEANNNTPIVDAIMEMELISSSKDIEDAEEGDLVFNTHGSGGIINNLSNDVRVGIDEYMEVSLTADNGHDTLKICGYKVYDGYKPKLNLQGYVTIIPIKEKMYSREQLIDAILNNTSMTVDEAKAYVEQNL